MSHDLLKNTGRNSAPHFQCGITFEIGTRKLAQQNTKLNL